MKEYTTFTIRRDLMADLKRYCDKRKYQSVSELLRDVLRRANAFDTEESGLFGASSRHLGVMA